jgi:Spy/CpxP family protein refolding chaperone
MKKLLVFSFTACLFSLTTMAQVNQTMDTTKKMEKHRGEWGERGGGMKALNLTPEQQQKIDAIRGAGRPNSPEERAAQQAKINEVLTPEQRTKMEQMKKERAERGGRKMEDGDKKEKIKGEEKEDDEKGHNGTMNKEKDEKKDMKGSKRGKRRGDRKTTTTVPATTAPAQN